MWSGDDVLDVRRNCALIVPTAVAANSLGVAAAG
jgi:hypothetical protein